MLFPSRVGFFSPLASLLSVPGRPCSLNFCLPEALPLRRRNCWNLPPSLGRKNVCPRVSRACHCLLPVLARPRQSEEGAWGQGEHLSSHEPVTSTLRHPRVTHEPALAARAGGRVCPPRTRGQWSTQSMARLPPLQSQPACRQDRVVASGADAVLGRQAGERPSSMEERGLWAGDAAGRGRRCLSPPLLSLPSSVRVWPCLLIQAPNLGSRARCGLP